MNEDLLEHLELQGFLDPQDLEVKEDQLDQVAPLVLLVNLAVEDLLDP